VDFVREFHSTSMLPKSSHLENRPIYIMGYMYKII